MADNLTSTVVGESILINGNLEGDEDLTVLGRVEGTIKLTKTLNVEESGIVKANIAVRNAIVSGVVVGNIEATDSVEITQVGRMVGDIRAPRVIIVDGARYRGAVDMGDLEAPRASGPLPARTTTSLARPATPMSRPSSLPPARRPTPPPPPPPPPKKSEAPTRPSVAASLAKPAAPVSARPTAPVSARPTAPVSAKPAAPVSAKPAAPAAPVLAANKKIKKKVVVKKKA